jgi:chorismate mutase
MEDIKQLRRRIDEVDKQILLALAERVNACKAIGVAKRKQGLPIKDSTRENEVYQQIKKKSGELGLDSSQVEAVYREIVNMCSAVQE